MSEAWLEISPKVFMWGSTVTPNFKPVLENKVYHISLSAKGDCILEEKEPFTFPSDMINIDEKFISKVCKHWNNTNQGNLGVILNGLKGTGKTVTVKRLALELKLPILLLDRPYKNIANIINSIRQSCIFFIDEFEKVFFDVEESETANFLSCIDGLNNSYRKVFLFTTNSLSINDSFKDRPSRIRYVKNYSSLPREIVENLIDTFLIHKEWKSNLLNAFSSFTYLTIDSVKSFIEEVNIQNEDPQILKEDFNIHIKSQITTIYKSKVIDLEKGIFQEERRQSEYFTEHIIPNRFSKDSVGQNLVIRDTKFGTIQYVIDENTCILDERELVCSEEEEEPSTKTLNLYKYRFERPNSEWKL